MRSFKLSALVTLALALMASASFAFGGAACHAGSASCSAAHASACSGMVGGCNVEAMRLPSGGLVVHYIGNTPEAISYLHAKADGSANKFCCAMTQKMASNDNCTTKP